MHSVRHFRSGGRANARKVQKRTMDKKGKQQVLLVAFGVALYAALMNLNEVAAFLTRLATLFTPVIIGLLMAFVLSVPMQGIAGRLTRLMPKTKEKHIDLLSLLLTLLCVVIVVVLLCVLALPQLAASLKSIGTLVRENWPDWRAFSRITAWIQASSPIASPRSIGKRCWKRRSPAPAR